MENCAGASWLVCVEALPAGLPRCLPIGLPGGFSRDFVAALPPPSGARRVTGIAFCVEVEAGLARGGREPVGGLVAFILAFLVMQYG